MTDSSEPFTNSKTSDCHDIEVAFQATTELLTNLIESMSDGIFVLNEDFKYTYWNKAMEKISKTPREGIINNNKAPWEIFPHLKKQGVDLMMKSVMAVTSV